MRKLLLALPLAAALFTVGCDRSEEYILFPPGNSSGQPGDSTALDSVTVTILPSLKHDVFILPSDTTDADFNFKYALYRQNGDNFEMVEGSKTTDASFDDIDSIKFDVLAGQPYTFVIWASAPESPYIVDLLDNGATLTVDYISEKANQPLTYAYFSNTEVNFATDTIIDLTLSSPFAQINVGTDDSSSLPDLYTTLKVSEAAGSMNLLSGEISGTVEDVTFTLAPASSGLEYPIEDVEYLAMAYILVGNELNNIEVTYSYSDNDLGTNPRENTVTNVPVLGGQRTWIYGSLVTSENKPYVAIGDVPTYDPSQPSPDPDPEPEPDPEPVTSTWDGATITYPAKSSTSGNYEINEASDLIGLAAMVNGTDGQTATDFEGETFVLNANIDFNYQEAPAIASGNTRSSTNVSGGNAFKGVFDGNGMTISNLIVKPTTSNSKEVVGYIGSLAGPNAIVKNITFENITVEAQGAEQAGAVVGTITDGATVSGVTVKSGSVTAEEAPGGIVGRMIISGTIENCENYATITSAKTNAGGIVGAAYYTSEGSSMTISGCNNYGKVSGTSQGVGGIVGLSAADINNCVNYGVVSNEASSTGGIVGEQNSAGSITNCINNGTVTGSTKSNNYGAGGIVGWIRYTNSSSYARQNVVEVTCCKNTADVSGPSGTGGIVGMWYSAGICNNNTNTAKNITAVGNFAAGIVGGSQWTEANPSNMTGYEVMLYVNDNISTTPYPDNITAAGSKAQYVYINTAEYTTATGNTDTLK